MGAAGATDRKRIVETYPYPDELGNILYEVVRYEPKEFRTRVPLGKGKYVWKLNGVRKVLYRLDYIHELYDQIIFVCEGEKDANNVVAQGLHATTCQGSVNGWLPEFGRVLKNNKVVILPHNDDTGRKFTEKVIASIDGVVQDWRVLELEGLPEKGDVSDWLLAGNTGLQLYRKALWALECSNPRKPADASATPGKPSPASGADENWRFERITLSTIKPEPVVWLWEPLWLDHAVNMLVGPPNAGKTFTACHLAASVSTGSQWPDGPGKAPLGDVVYLTTENNKAQVLVPRLKAAGADLDRIHTWTVKRRKDRNGEMVEDDVSLEDVAAMMNAIDDTPNLRLIIVDPVTAYMGSTEPNDNKEVRKILNGVVKIAEEKRVCVVLLSHLKKSVTNAINAVMGAQSFVAVARVVNSQFKDPDYAENKRRVIVPFKNNEAVDDITGKRFKIVTAPGTDNRGCIVWDAEPETRTADDIMSAINAKTAGNGRDTSADDARDARHNKLLHVLDRMTTPGDGWVSVLQIREALGWNGSKMKSVLWEMTQGEILEERSADRVGPNGGVVDGGKHEIRRVRFDQK